MLYPPELRARRARVYRQSPCAAMREAAMAPGYTFANAPVVSAATRLRQGIRCSIHPIYGRAGRGVIGSRRAAAMREAAMVLSWSRRVA